VVIKESVFLIPRLLEFATKLDKLGWRFDTAEIALIM
jgi:hypothetical protein